MSSINIYSNRIPIDRVKKSFFIFPSTTGGA